MKTISSFGFALLTAGIGFAASVPTTNNLPVSQAKASGTYIEARSADVYTGACFANSEEGLIGNLAVMGWKIEKGSYDGVDLANLGVVGVVRAKSTLGAVNVNSYPVKAVLIIDEKANAEQRLALKKFAQHMGGELLSDVVRIEYKPIDLTLVDNNIHSMTAKLQAGDLAKIETRPLVEGDQICRHEEVWYLPLTKTEHAMPAYTMANSFRGEGLGTTWNNPNKRSAFVGSFVDNQ